MSEAWPRLQNLPDDGLLWLLTWLGPLYLDTTVSSQRLLLASISSVSGSVGRTPAQLFGRAPPRPDQLGRQRLVSFAVGELPMLTVGTFYRQRQPLIAGSGTLTQRTFTIDFRQQRPFRLDEVPDGEPGPVLSSADCLLAATWPPMAHGSAIGLAQRGDGFAVCVPAAEVLRWCYGSSSRMLQAVLSTELPGVIREVQKTLVRDGRFLDLNLPDGFVDQDAATLGWLATDADALKAARRVNLSTLANKKEAERRGRLSHPTVPFPYQQVLSFTALGRVIPHEPRPRFLVHRILRTDLTLPFQVRLSVPSFERKPAEPGAPQPAPRGRRRGRARADTSTLVTNREPRRQGRAVLLPALASQFSAAHVLHRQLPVPASDAPPVHSFSLPAPTGPFSTGLGEDRNSHARKATLTLLKPPRPPADEPVQNDAFDVLRLVFDHFRKEGTRVQELPLNNPGGQEGRFTQWHHEDGTRVACLVAGASRSSQVWYLFEQERREGEYGPLLLAQRPGGRAASTLELKDLLEQAEGPNTWPRTHGLWTLVHVRHGFRSVEGFSAGLRSRMGWDTQPGSPETP